MKVRGMAVFGKLLQNMANISQKKPLPVTFMLEAYFFQILREILHKKKYIAISTSKMAPYRHNSPD